MDTLDQKIDEYLKGIIFKLILSDVDRKCYKNLDNFLEIQKENMKKDLLEKNNLIERIKNDDYDEADDRWDDISELESLFDKKFGIIDYQNDNWQSDPLWNDTYAEDYRYDYAQKLIQLHTNEIRHKKIKNKIEKINDIVVDISGENIQDYIIEVEI